MKSNHIYYVCFFSVLLTHTITSSDFSQNTVLKGPDTVVLVKYKQIKTGLISNVFSANQEINQQAVFGFKRIRIQTPPTKEYSNKGSYNTLQYHS